MKINNLILLLLSAFCEALPTVKVSNDSLPSAMLYLMKYGYMEVPSPETRSAQLLSPNGLLDYILEFQAFAGLPRTGVLDARTIEMMNTPRCGVKDFIGAGSGAKRKKRYALQGSRWKVKELTYRISKYPTTQRLSKQEVDKEIEKALKVWSEVTDLTFEQRRSGKVHIDIRFESFHHGDGDPFDGVGGTLAHAFFPVYGGDAHFDNSETWTINSFKGTNLLQTAAHEFGHSLGLSHSDQYNALMAPFYRGYESKVTLDKDDVKAIQALYGKKGEKRPKPSTTPPIFFPTGSNTPGSTPESNEDLCEDSSVDSMLTTLEGDSYAFKGGIYWKLTEDSIASGYPRSIYEDWDGLPSGIQASFSWVNGKTYFFKGSQYWRHSGSSMDIGYPKDISSGFAGIPSNIDAVFVWSGNGKIYFFKGSQYWRYDPGQNPPVKSFYPKPISNWDGIPDHIDDVIHYSNGFTYFFKKGFYYRFNDATFSVSKSAEPPYPRSMGYWWFGCPESPNQDF